MYECSCGRRFRLSAETRAAFQKVQDYLDGKITLKSYASFDELMAEIDAEIAEEDALAQGDGESRVVADFATTALEGNR